MSKPLSDEQISQRLKAAVDNYMSACFSVQPAPRAAAEIRLALYAGMIMMFTETDACVKRNAGDDDAGAVELEKIRQAIKIRALTLNAARMTVR